MALRVRSFAVKIVFTVNGGKLMASYTRAYLLQSLSGMAIRKTQTKDILSGEVGKSQRVLVSARTVFPFTLFPDTITIDRIRVTIAHNIFFKVATLLHIRIEDIITVTPSFGPIFASLKIITNSPADTDNPYIISYLTKADALKINRILKGYRIALDKDIKVDQLSNDELVETLDYLSEDYIDT